MMAVSRIFVQHRTAAASFAVGDAAVCFRPGKDPDICGKQAGLLK